MWPFRKKKRLLRQALKNKNLQLALERASNHHWRQYEKLAASMPLEELKAKARQIKEECLANLPALIKEFIDKATEAGSKVYLAESSEEALKQIDEIISKRQARLIIKSKSMVSEEIGLNNFLIRKGIQVVETDLGEWIVQLAGEKPSHITAPALHKTKEEIASLLSQHLGRPVPPDSREITRAARDYMRPLFFQADIGISGANLAIAESGTLVIISNEGNARLVTSLPPVHIAIFTVEKIVATMEQAVTLIKALVTSASGKPLTSYVSFISGPSSTTDIEKEQVIGVHGPEELHIIILDNGRLAIAESEKYREILACLKCGGCMLVCPIFQILGGHVFGGPVYPGGIGLLFSFMTRSTDEISFLLSLCADCKKCESFCPVGIHTGELLLRLKNDLGPGWGEKILSFFMRKKNILDKFLKLLSVGQKFWSKEAHWKPLPIIWIKDKRIPLIKIDSRNRKKEKQRLPKERPRVYLFEGCLNRFFFPEITERVGHSLETLGFEPHVSADQVCCGAPSFHLGDQAGLRKLLDQNLNSWKRENPSIILTFCPTGYHVLKKIYPQIEPEARVFESRIYDLISFAESLGLRLNAEKSLRDKRIFYHPPCHLLARGEKLEERVSLLKKAGLPIIIEGKQPACCGFCGVFSFRHPQVAARLWKKKKAKIISFNPEIIITECPGCLFQLKSGLIEGKEIKGIYHLAEIITFEATEEKKPGLAFLQ